MAIRHCAIIPACCWRRAQWHRTALEPHQPGERTLLLDRFDTPVEPDGADDSAGGHHTGGRAHRRPPDGGQSSWTGASGRPTLPWQDRDATRPREHRPERRLGELLAAAASSRSIRPDAERDAQSTLLPRGPARQRDHERLHDDEGALCGRVGWRATARGVSARASTGMRASGTTSRCAGGGSWAVDRRGAAGDQDWIGLFGPMSVDLAERRCKWAAACATATW